jgi:hypothetical protein
MSAPIVTIWKDKWGKKINAARKMNLAEVERVILKAPPVENKDQLALLKFAEFGDVWAMKDGRKTSLRHDANVIKVTGLEGDYDLEKMPMDEALAILRGHKIKALFYTSASHKLNAPRWRVLCPLATALTGSTSELQKGHYHQVGVLNALLGGVLNGESFTLSQSYYFGRIKGADAPIIARLEEGICIDELEHPPKPQFPSTQKAKPNGGQTTDTESRARGYKALRALAYSLARSHLSVTHIKAVLHAELDTYPEGTKTSDGVELRDRVTPLAESAVAKKGQLSGEDIDEDDEFANCDPRIVEDLKHLQAKELVLPNDYVPVPWAATRMFKQLAKEKSLFVRGRKLVEIDKKKKELVAVPLDAFRSRIQRHRVKAAVITARKDVFLKLKECSADTAKLLLGSEAMSEHLPSLSLVTKSAVLVEREGQLVTLGPGYSADDGGILVFAQEPPPIVPLDEAIKALLDLIKEFQFVDESDLSRAMAGFIGPAIRMGKLAAHKATVNVVEADHSHAGKGYLLELSRAIYGDQGFRVSRQDGGVGSADESLGEAIFKAPPFVYIDNLRGRFASEFFESAITAPDQENVPVRLFGKGHATADISRITFQVTSNGFETTEDMGNRSLITRIRKRPNVHQFKKYDEGDVLEHVKAKHTTSAVRSLSSVNGTRRVRKRCLCSMRDFMNGSGHSTGSCKR